MDDEQKRFSIRRFGRKDRKRRLESSGPLLPETDFAASPAEHSADDVPSTDPLPFDPMADASDAADVSGEVDAALSAVGELDDSSLLADFEVALLHPAEDGTDKPAPEPLVDYPPGERFPPLNPNAQSSEKPVTKSTAPPRKRRPARQDVIALLFFLGTMGLIAYFVTLWQNPYSALNPLPPPTTYVEVTITPLPTLPPTPTDEPTVGPTPTFTPLAGFAQEDTATPSPFAFVLAETGVIYVPNDNGKGCDWSSIAGTVTNMQGEALDGYGIQVTGETLEEKVFSGTALTFGEGGFELFLNGVPQQAQYFVQLFSPTGAPLSDRFSVITSDQCEQNVAVIRFVQQHPF